MNQEILKKSKIQLTVEHIQKYWILYLMMIPATVLLILFTYGPMYGIIMAFQDFTVFKGYTGSPFVGLKHFQRLFSDPLFYRLFKNTFMVGVLDFLFSFPAPLIFALILNEVRKVRFKSVVQSISYLPHFIPLVVMVGIIFELFGSYGIINSLLSSLGMEPISFFTKSEWFLPLYIGSGVWKTIGWGSIIYMGALTNIDSTLYEAADMDGANRWHKMWHVTLPSLRPTVVTLFILNAGGIMQVGFEKVFLMSSPATYEVSDVLSTYVYRQGILNSDFSYSAAVGLFNNIVALLFVLLANKIAKKLGEEGIV
ncbi:protein LplB [Streptococcus pneumoniae]|uniref:ABC transporter permease subunit n=5 Tax=Streptococcus pneumoniae TaxID=1313 RepID=A0A0B7LXI4_STREE|nr:ABC transporter permease subunit [Streptococcus pneumoniae]EDK69793.1 sugar ABC transporter substrate binding protein [Streptococcus pneumoniae SP19-BS75]EDK75331.1 sugar ABC transporter substrate binding protein [Streptococcus pneumoniae SP6-BS73]EHD29881.1 binding--dependent transport system inner membrane component family protein [Streptococcus pneumoniae GA11184]EHD33918.1 binding--dependent transport system inner membrane component family protein [Streptococcus pneumoniae 6735-05]EHD42